MLTRSGIVGRGLPAKFALGVNLSGMQGSFPAVPTLAEMAYFVSKGIKTFRIPIMWAELNYFFAGNVGIQPTPFGPLDTTSTYLTPQSTANLILQSQAIATAPWTTFINGTGTITVTNNAAIAPDGTTTATLVSVNRSDTSSYAVAYQDYTDTVATYTGSIWLKANSAGDVGKLITLEIGNSNLGIGFTTVTLTNSWVRYSVTGAITSTSAQLSFGYRSDATGPTTGAVGILAWGVQVNAGASPTTYVATVGGYVAALDSIVSNAASLGATVLIDVHNFGFSSGLAGAFLITSLTSSGTTVTATTSGAANLVNGASVSIQGANPSAYNGSFTIFNVTSTTFQYTAGSAPGTSPATGTSDQAGGVVIYGGESTSVGTPRLPVAAFADLWGKISARYKGNPGVRGYDLMNEWVNGFDIAIVMAANQAAINAIRANGDFTKIYIEGTNYSGAWNWVTGQGNPYNNANLNQLIDPADNLIFSTHGYLDRDGSGSHFSWATEIADPGESPPGTPVSHQIGVERMTPVVQWAQEHNVRLHLGEIGCSNDALSAGGNDDYNDWNITMDNVLAFCQANNVEVDVWGPGPGFATSYPFNMDPSAVSNPAVKDYSSAGLQATQMVLLEKYSGYSGPQPTAYRVDLPLDGSLNPIVRGSSGVTTGNFTVRYGGKITSPVTITPFAHFPDGTSAGGTFTPASVTLPAGNNAIAYFTYTPAVAATLLIGTTNNAGWTDPSTVGFTTATDSFQALSVSPVNIFGLRRLYAPYIGPAIRLQRASDSAQMDFYFDNFGNLPRQAIQTWASSRAVNVVTIYDQTLNANNLTYTGGNFPVLTLQNAQGYPEITWASGSKMDFNSPDAGQTGQTVMARINDTSGEQYFIRQDEFVGAFYFGPSAYTVESAAPASTVNFTPQVGSWHHYAGTFQSNTTNGIVAYLDGTQTSAANSQNYTLATAGGPGTQMGYFRFVGGLFWVGSWQDVVILNGAISPTQVAAFAASDATYYSTPLPDSLAAVSPTIANVVSSQIVVGSHFNAPFAGVTVSDLNSGATDSVSITITGDSGATLTGTGLSGSNPYTIASATPASITTTLKALQYQSTSSSGTIGTLAMTVTSSAGSFATASVAVTITAYVAETPYPAPSGTWTPIAGAATYKGVNMMSVGQAYPATSQFNYAYAFDDELDYFASKGMGLIRQGITSGRFFPNAYGPADPPNRTDEPAQAYRPFPAGSQTNLLSIKAILDHAFTLGMRILLDPHDFCSVWDGRIQTTRNAATDPEGVNLLADQLSRLATIFKNYPNVVFSLNNEPDASTAQQWHDAALIYLAAIRAAGATQMVFISGGGSFDSGFGWNTIQGTIWDTFNQPGWTGNNGDPLNNFAFEMHAYLDSNNSGQIDNVRSVGFGNTVLVGATTWCRQTNGGTARANPFKAFLGEFGTSSSAQPMAELANELNYTSTNSDVWLGWTFFTGGSRLFYANYTLGLAVPIGAGSQPDTAPGNTDTPQMGVLVQYLS